MTITLARHLQETSYPPIAEALSWIADRKSNRELLNMCQAVPSYPPAPALQDEFGRLAHLPGMGGYTEILGVPELRQSLTRHFEGAHHAKLEVGDVGVTTGCNQAFAAAVMAVAQAGDNILIPSPWYFNHHMWLQMMGIKARAIPAFSSDGPWPAVADAKKKINTRTRAIALCTPNNPTGAIYPPEVLEGFYRLAKQENLTLIIDETYIDFRPTSAPPHHLLAHRDWRDNLVLLFSFSKIYALAGYRLGAMVAGPRIMNEATKVLDTMTICPPQIAQRGVLFALSGVEAWKQEKRQLMAGRLEALRRAFMRPELKFELASSGAYFAYVRHPFAEQKSKAVARRLAEKHDVLCLPGEMFGPGQERYLRFAFANVDQSKMSELVDRLIESQMG